MTDPFGPPAWVGTDLWSDQVRADGDTYAPRPPLAGDTVADVAIVGAGLTGLWTAYYLLDADPGLRIVVVERDVAGAGASGRNGGWCSALFPTPAAALAEEHGDAAARAMRAAMRDTVVEVGAVTRVEDLACDFAYGGNVTVARSAPQLARARAEAADAVRWGDEVTLLDAEDARARLAATRVRGATVTPDCARLQPARLVRGLARVVESRGVRIAERTTALRIAPRAVVTDQGIVRARHVVRATEAFTPLLPGGGRQVVPVYSLMVATEPLPADFWAATGLARFETFADHRHLVIYGQRTADDRIAFGGRGAPYRWGSALRADLHRDGRVFEHLRRTLVDLFPAVADARITHRWGGAVAAARDWHASVGHDPRTGLAWAGGYVGDGLSTTNLAGRTLADLVTGQDTEITRLPWVGHRSPRWEPEPLRWLGVNTGLRAAELADLEERVTGRESVVARALAQVVPH